MDEFLRDYGILVTAVIGLGMAILGYFFGKWDSERKRKWELDDRKVDRRTKVRDDIIKEARLYVDTFWDIVQSYSMYELYLGAGVQEDVIKQYQDYINNARLENKKRTASIYSLNDAELELLHGVCTAVFTTENEEKRELEESIAEGKLIDHDALLKRVPSFNAVMLQYITKMKIRLDELAQEVP